jgi:hypothetical protein
MKKKTIISLLGLLSITLLGGCQLVKESEKKQISYDEIVKDGKIDVEKAKEAGYVSLEEKEKLGYYTLEVSSNKEVQKQAMEQENDIFKNIKPLIEENVGREVKLLGIASPFPYPTINVEYVTVDEPVVSSRVSLGLEDSSYFNKGGVKDVSGGEELGSQWQSNTIGSLYGYIYEDQLNLFKEHFLKNHPEYQEDANKSSEISALRLNMFTIYPSSVYGNENIQKQKETINNIYSLYKQNKSRTKEEWRTIFHENKLTYTLSFRCTLTEESSLPTKKMAEDIFNEMESSSYLSNFNDFRVIVRSNMQATNENGPLHSELKFIDTYPKGDKK